MRQLPIIFGLALIAAALGVLVYFDTREEPPIVIETDMTPATTFGMEDALDELPDVPEVSGGTQEQVSGLKNEVMVTASAGNESEDFDEEAALMEELAGFDFDNSNLPDFMKNMTEEERSEFQRYMRSTFSKLYGKIAQRREKKKKEREHKKAVQDAFRKMRFRKDQRAYIEEREKATWERIQDTMKYAKKNRWRKTQLQEELKNIRKAHRGEMDDYLGGKKYSTYLDQVKRNEDPAYANRSDISSLASKVASLEKLVKSLQSAMSKKGVKIQPKKPVKKQPKKPKAKKKKPAVKKK